MLLKLLKHEIDFFDEIGLFHVKGVFPRPLPGWLMQSDGWSVLRLWDIDVVSNTVTRYRVRLEPGFETGAKAAIFSSIEEKTDSYEIHYLQRMIARRILPS